MSIKVEKLDWPSPDVTGSAVARLVSLRRYLWPVLVALCLVAVIAASMGIGPGGGKGAPVRLERVEVGSLEVEVLAPGVVEPRSRLEIRYSHESATVAEILAEPGERVVKGQPLIVLDGQGLRERVSRTRWEYLQALQRVSALGESKREADATRLELQLERLNRQLEFQEALLAQRQELFGKSLVSRNELDRAGLEVETARLAVAEAQVELGAFDQQGYQEDLESAQAEVAYRRLSLEQAESALQAATVRAPCDGAVLEMPAQPGALLERGALAAVIADMGVFQVSAMVDELEISNLRPGQTVFLESGFFAGQTLHGTVERIVPTVTPHRGVPSAKVMIKLEGSILTPPDGLSVDVRIRVDGTERATLVPLEAIVERNGTNVVFVADNNLGRSREVVVGLRNESQVEIVRGVEPGEMVVTSGHVFLEDGDRIQPVDETEAGALKVEFFK